jgi:hypothetical protein
MTTCKKHRGIFCRNLLPPSPEQSANFRVCSVEDFNTVGVIGLLTWSSGNPLPWCLQRIFCECALLYLQLTNYLGGIPHRVAYEAQDCVWTHQCITMLSVQWLEKSAIMIQFSLMQAALEPGCEFHCTLLNEWMCLYSTNVLVSILSKVRFMIKFLKEILSLNLIWNFCFTKFHSLLWFGILFLGEREVN